jgi:hypothetical protein
MTIPNKLFRIKPYVLVIKIKQFRIIKMKLFNLPCMIQVTPKITIYPAVQMVGNYLM